MFVLEVFAEEEKVTFYAVREPEDSETLQTIDFIKRVSKTKYKDELNFLLNLILDHIGNKHGARDYFFNRLERNATALPPAKKGGIIKELKHDEVNFNLLNSKIRLYCLRLSDSVVVLFNGGIKESKGTAQNDPGVSLYFRDADRYAKKILQAIAQKDICLKHKKMVSFDNETNNILI